MLLRPLLRLLPRCSPLVLFVAVCVLATACGSSTEPAVGAEAGRYVATSAGGRPVPAVIDTAEQEFDVLLADTLDLDGRGGARLALAIRRVNTALRTDTVLRITNDRRYRRQATRVEVGSFAPCPPSAMCVANDEGTITADGIALTSYRYVSGARLVFARVAP